MHRDTERERERQRQRQREIDREHEIVSPLIITPRKFLKKFIKPF